MMAAGKSKPTDQIKAEPFEGSYPCFGGNGIRGYVDEYSHDGAFSIVGRQGALCGNINIAFGKFYATEHAVVTSLFSGIDFNWSNYALEALQLNKYATGAAQPGLSVANVLNIFVPVPPTQEQIRIGTRIAAAIETIEVIEQEKLDLQTIIATAKSKILDLAIRGKLVPQDPNDEPASVLLERIRAEKEELIKQGKIKRNKKESVIFKGEDNSYYEKISELPCGWSIASFSQVNMFSAKTVDPNNTPKEIFELYSVPNFEVGIPEILSGQEIGSSKQELCENDVLVCKINPRINRVWITKHITPYHLLGSSEWIVFRNRFLFAPYLQYYFSSPHFRELMLSNVSGVGGSLMRAQPESVKKYPVLIPPYQEQIRIAECIDDLLVLLAAIEQSFN